MADRSQNIVINYKFNTAEIEKASAILNRANQSTNNLQQQAQQSGQKIAQSFTSPVRAIESMNIQLAKLKISIQLSSDPKRIAELSNQYKTLKTQIDAATKSAFQLPKALKETDQATKSLSSQFGQLYTAVKLVITAGIVREVVSIGLEMAKLAGNVEGVELAFRRTFPDSENLLFNLKRATHGAVSEFELMQRTLQATNLGVAVEHLPVLFEFAASRAQQTGESVDYLVDSIVRGIGRKSILVLDNLGLSATRLKEQFGGAALASQSVADVTKGVAEIARVELEKMGGYAETAATKVDILASATARFRQELAKKVTQDGGFIDFLRDYVEVFGDAIEASNRGIAVAELAEEQRIKEIANISANEFSLRVLTGTKEENIKAIEDEVAALTKSVGAYAKERDAAQATIDKLKSLLVGRFDEDIQIKQNIQTQLDYIASKKGDALIDQEILKILQAKLLALKKVNEEEIVATGIIQRKKAEIEALQEQLQATNDMADLGAGGRLTKALEIANAELGDLQRAFREFHIKEFNNNIKDATKSMGFLSDAMKGVEARLSESMEALSTMKLPLPPSIIPNDFWDNMAVEFEENWRDILSSGVDIQADLINNTLQTELDNYKRRLVALRDFYDEQQILAGDNERAKTQLRLREERDTSTLQRKIFEKEKQTRRSQAVIDGAAGVVKAFATYPYPAALVISALIAAQTLAQIRNINRQRSGYAKGVIDLQGPGTGISDSIPANLSKGESVMTAWETHHAGDVLKDIRAKKLDNKVLKELKQGRQPAQSQAFNDERIIKAIEKNRPPDVIEQSGIVYEVKTKGDNYRMKVRAKSGRFRL